MGIITPMPGSEPIDNVVAVMTKCVHLKGIFSVVELMTRKEGNLAGSIMMLHPPVLLIVGGGRERSNFVSFGQSDCTPRLVKYGRMNPWPVLAFGGPLCGYVSGRG